MKIYHTSAKDSIYHYTLGLMGLPVTDTTTITLKDFMTSANVWYNDINEWIWKSQNYWQHNDLTSSTLPTRTTELVDERQDYTLPTTAFDILGVEVLDSNGNYVELKPITEVPGAKSEYYKTSGFPIYYELVSDVISLYPKPSASKVTTTAGLKIYTQEEVTQFNETSTWSPGIPRAYHSLIGMGVAKDKSFTFGMDNLYQKLTIEINNKRKELESHFAKRHRNIKKQIVPRVHVSGI